MYICSKVCCHTPSIVAIYDNLPQKALKISLLVSYSMRALLTCGN